MPFTLDAEIAAALSALPADTPVPVKGDWRALRALGVATLAELAKAAAVDPGVRSQTFRTVAPDGAEIELRWWTKDGGAQGPAVVYAHGGGMVFGSLDLYAPVITDYVSATGVPFLGVEYRLAPEAQGETLARDVFAGLSWLVEHAARLGVDPSRIAIMGDSAGGGLAAATAMLARDAAIPLAHQILVYPMLDDRNLHPCADLEPFAVWTYENNYTGWRALIGEEPGVTPVAAVVAPARMLDPAGLAPAYIEVGELDIFRDEDIRFAARLMESGVSVELHIHRGAPHAFERLAPRAQVSLRAMADRHRVLRSL